MSSRRLWNSALILFVVSLSMAITATAQTFTTLDTDVYSCGALVQGIDGNLYGSYCLGAPENYGAIFKITPEGTLTTVKKFEHENGPVEPTGLVLGMNGSLYGTSRYGGAQSSTCPTPLLRCGTVFELTPAGDLVTLHSFSGPDGMYPQGGLTLGPDGNLYGTTTGIEKRGATGAVYGTVFKITPSGTFTALHTFSFSDGAYPTSPLALGIDGRFYGTTPEGPPGGGGTVFAITTGGTFTSLHSFTSAAAGVDPSGALVQVANGEFYGTNGFGGSGCNGSSGTIYYISPGGRTFATFYQFSQICNYGSNPTSGLVLGNDGNFYGATSATFGSSIESILYEITPKADLTTLYRFGYSMSELAGGVNLMQSTNGDFYGTDLPSQTENNSPQVFRLSTGLGPFITAVPAMRGIGARVLLLGRGLTGTTRVTFNGVPASFTVDSDTEITTFVPAGATHGYIQVTTPDGTVSTKVIFVIG
jgi:uncharacterized repeat protein (TIGR03803 family)